jgi:hypothetical protein
MGWAGIQIRDLLNSLDRNIREAIESFENMKDSAW